MKDFSMSLNFVVKRVRSSVTQGEAKVYCNGEYVTNFSDKIEMVKEGQKYYGEKIGNWASVEPDAKFIKAALFHEFDSIYHISDPVKKIIDDAIKEQEESNWDISMI